MKVLFIPLFTGGHTNSMLGLAEELLGRGHEVVLLLAPTKAKQLDTKGFTVELLDVSGCPLSDEAWSYSIVDYISKNVIHSLWDINRQISDAINRVKPNLIVWDTISVPAAFMSKVPTVTFWSMNPFGLVRPREIVPYPLDSIDKVGMEIARLFCVHGQNLVERITGGEFQFPRSRLLNFYMFPKEIDYECDKASMVNTLNLEISFNPEKYNNKVIDESLLNFIKKSSKLVLISFGTCVSSDAQFMRKIVKMCSQSKHHFIVTKGVNHSEYELPLNMWGKEYIPQRQLLPYVDLVITHGGNNTFTEAFYYGKPQIIIPQVADQSFNAMRLQTKDLGVYIKRDKLTKVTLLDAIDNLLENKRINQRLFEISKRMQKEIKEENKLSKAAEMIEKLVK